MVDTEMTQVADFMVPSFVMAVIVALPSLIAVTTPFGLTVATFVFDDVQFNSLLLVVTGLKLAVKTRVFPGCIDAAVLSREILVANVVTVTIHVAVFDPSTVVTVMVAVPFDTAVTTPDALTVATDVLLLFQLTFVLDAVDGFTVATRVLVPPGLRDSDVLFRLTPVTGIVTVTVQVAVFAPSTVVTVITAVPHAIPWTLPLSSTVATDSLLLCHVTSLFEAPAGFTVAISVDVPPTLRSSSV